MTNAEVEYKLTYYGTLVITRVKSFYVPAYFTVVFYFSFDIPHSLTFWACILKHFTIVINSVLQKARVFVTF